ncbi:MAG: hypothetical protein GDA56_16265 [Hormoscilla sp. GM7CHS1pb]|nr:hypothetical protein [Hormoscilla sp. GM7CHS1pb]
MIRNLIVSLLPIVSGLFPTAIAASTSETAMARIIEIKGEVQLMRRTWNEYRPTNIGTDLYRGDLVQPAPGAVAIVYCAADNRIERLPNGVPSGIANLCTPVRPLADDRAFYRGTAPSAIDPEIPYLISPRATLLLEDRPLLRWNAVPGTQSYTVKLVGPGVYWETQVQTNYLKYPGDQPLQPGANYQIIVYSDNEASSLDEDSQGLEFTLLSRTRARQVREEIAQLQQQQLPDTAFALALARLYSKHGLFAEAIATLEKLIENGTQTAAIDRILGELYEQVGLIPLGDRQYQQHPIAFTSKE